VRDGHGAEGLLLLLVVVLDAAVLVVARCRVCLLTPVDCVVTSRC